MNDGLPRELTQMGHDEVVQLLARHVWETNLLLRYLALCGYTVHADVVDRTDAVYHARPEIIVNVT